MSEPPDGRGRVGEWVEKAEHDLLVAGHTLTLGEQCPFDMVAYHAQQCTEKYLKALLVLRSGDCPWTHDLRILMQRAGAGGEVARPMGQEAAKPRCCGPRGTPEHA